MDKWRLQADSAHQTGLDTALEEVLIVDALSSSRITVTIRQLPLDIMQSTDPHSQPQPETMPDIILSSQVPNDGNTSMLPSFANTDALSSPCIRQLPIVCQPLTPSTDPLSELSRLPKGATDKLSL